MGPVAPTGRFRADTRPWRRRGDRLLTLQSRHQVCSFVLGFDVGPMEPGPVRSTADDPRTFSLRHAFGPRCVGWPSHDICSVERGASCFTSLRSRRDSHACEAGAAVRRGNPADLFVEVMPCVPMIFRQKASREHAFLDGKINNGPERRRGPWATAPAGKWYGSSYRQPSAATRFVARSPRRCKCKPPLPTPDPTVRPRHRRTRRHPSSFASVRCSGSPGSAGPRSIG